MPDDARSAQRHLPLIDVDVWCDVCKDGLATFSIDYDQEAEARRSRRLRLQTVSSPPTAGPNCHICDKICASILDCAVIYASTIAHPQLSSTASSSISIRLLQASKQCLFVSFAQNKSRVVEKKPRPVCPSSLSNRSAITSPCR